MSTDTDSIAVPAEIIPLVHDSSQSSCVMILDQNGDVITLLKDAQEFVAGSKYWWTDVS